MSFSIELFFKLPSASVLLFSQVSMTNVFQLSLDFFFLRFNHVFEKESDIDRYPLPARAAEAQTRTLIQDGGLACCVIMLIHSLFLSQTHISYFCYKTLMSFSAIYSAMVLIPKTFAVMFLIRSLGLVYIILLKYFIKMVYIALHETHI